MHIRIVTFRLAGPTHEEYEAQSTAIAEAFAAWPGLQAKFWLGDAGTGTYGGVYVFDDVAAADASRSTPEFAALTSMPIFDDVRIEEHAVLAGPTAVTAGPLAVP